MKPARPAVAGYLGVSGVVADECGTGPEDRQRQCEQQGPPGVSEEYQAGEHATQGEEVGGDHGRVPSGAPLQEPLRLHGPQERREVAADSRRRVPDARAPVGALHTSGTVAGAVRDGGYGLGHVDSGLWEAWEAALTC